MRVNFTAPNRRHAQAYESPYVSAAREVVRTQSLQKIDGIILDLFTASAIVQVYDAVSENKRDQLNQLSLTELADLALKVLSRTASNSFPPKDDIEGGGAEQDSPASPSAPGVGENLSEAKSINDGDVILESNGSGVITYRVTEARPDGNSILLSVIKNESEEMTLRVPGGEKLQVLPGSSAADAPPPTKEDSGDGEEEGSKDPEDANEPGDEDEDEGKGEDEDNEKDEEDKK